jgi:hypothetical protein
MREKNATREVQQITEDTFVLTDKFHSDGKITVKQKLVCLFPERLMWTSTHLTGPAKHSQFIYEITAVTRTTSRLKFTALHIARDIKEGVHKAEIERLAEELRKEDSDVWKNLAREMEKKTAGKRGNATREPRVSP